MILIKNALINELIINDDTAKIELLDCKIETVVVGSIQEDIMQELEDK